MKIENCKLKIIRVIRFIPLRQKTPWLATGMNGEVDAA